MRELLPGGGDLVANGQLRFGTFDAPFQRVNPLDADVLGGVPLPRALKAFRLKEWQAVQFGNGRYFLNVALFNAKTLAIAQVKLYDRQTQRKVLFEKKLPPWAFALPNTLLDSETRYGRDGWSLHFRNKLQQGQLSVTLDIPAQGQVPQIRGRITGHTAGWTPMVVSIPFGRNHGMYSHKGLIPLEGVLAIGDETITFACDDSYLLMDDHKGYYPWEMAWDWATAAGFLPDGRLCGFNLTRNQSIDPQRYNENGFWLDGRLHLLPPVRFTRSGSGDHEQWRIVDDEGRVDLTLHVDVDGRIDINALILRSKYRGPFGTYNGRIVDSDGRPHTIENLFGMAEDFYLRC